MATSEPVDPNPLPPAERKLLKVRLRRLEDAEESYKTAIANLAALAERSVPNSPVAKGEVRVRETFAFSPEPAPEDSSDRKLPPKEFWPPAGRLVTPRGAALKLMLIALFEAQTRTRPGRRPDNPRPLHGRRNEIAWADLLATDAKPALGGKTVMSVPAKKARHLFSALELMRTQDLLQVPNPDAQKRKHEGFLLNDEGGKRVSGPNDLYTVPAKKKDEFFTLPLGLFTHGWIHALEDRDLRYLLMLCRYHKGAPPEGFRVNAWVRLRHMAIGPDIYERHHWFTRFGLNAVTPDDGRRDDGTFDDYSKGRKAIPHTLQLLPEGFERDGLRVVTRVIDDLVNS
ncbi:hypothetical protein [Micromonospora sp. NPDC005172]|uniref:hypothetical protein n=1 Tax=Micromonospora sp. NPDC005172 TaxID=3156867 RepID=UPI0033B1E56B